MPFRIGMKGKGTVLHIPGVGTLPCEVGRLGPQDWMEHKYWHCLLLLASKKDLESVGYGTDDKYFAVLTWMILPIINNRIRPIFDFAHNEWPRNHTCPTMLKND